MKLSTLTKIFMKTGKIFWQLRLEFFQKEFVSIENSITSIQNEVKRLVDFLTDDTGKALSWKMHNETLAQITAKNIELKQQYRFLTRCKARIIECEKNLKIVESPKRISYI